MALGEGVKDAPVAPAGLPVLAPDETLILALDEGVMVAPGKEKDVLETPVATDEALRLALGEGVKEAPVAPAEPPV